MTREEAIKELERISEDTVKRECSTCGRLHIGTYSGICALCSLCECVPDYAKEYHKKYQTVSRWKWNGRWDNEALDMAISALMEQHRWISVGERLPEELVPVLIYEPEYARGYKSMATAFRINGCWHGCVDGAVTHWMPLPKPPEVEG